jgi:DNA-binding NarL/FixJ family response regulator
MSDARHGRNPGHRLNYRRPAGKVRILATFDLDQYVFAGLKASASGLLLKDAPPA